MQGDTDPLVCIIAKDIWGGEDNAYTGQLPVLSNQVRPEHLELAT